MYAGRGSDKNQSYTNAQQCFHFRGSRLRIAVAGCGICGTLFLIRSLTDFSRDPLAAGGNRVPLPRTWKQRLMPITILQKSADIHGYSRRCIWTIEMGFMNGKDVSRTVRMGFMDTFVVSHSTRELTERRSVMDKTLYNVGMAFRGYVSQAISLASTLSLSFGKVYYILVQYPH